MVVFWGDKTCWDSDSICLCYWLFCLLLYWSTRRPRRIQILE